MKDGLHEVKNKHIYKYIFDYGLMKFRNWLRYAAPAHLGINEMMLIKFTYSNSYCNEKWRCTVHWQAIVL